MRNETNIELILKKLHQRITKMIIKLLHRVI